MLLAAIAVFYAAGDAPEALAVEAGLNCETYTDGVCEVEIGDIFFCSDEFEPGVCPSSVVAGETVRWFYPASGTTNHTTTECGADCDNPAGKPLWDSGFLDPGESFEFTFDNPGEFLYYCALHPFQRGIIRVLEADAVFGDVDCGGSVNAIDAALILQLGAGLLDELTCGQNADVNQDGATDSVDAALVLQLTAGLLDSLPV
jgi:plastocyanin